jgi:hypothetical protein
MITLINNLPGNILGYKYEGEITGNDYEMVLYPTLALEMNRHRELRVLCEVENNFKGINFSALWDDASLIFKYYRHWKKIAFVSDKKWMNRIIATLGIILPGHVRTFTNNDLRTAEDWLGS